MRHLTRARAVGLVDCTPTSFIEAGGGHQLCCGWQGTAMQCTSGGARDVIGPGQNLRGGIASAMSYQKIAKRGLEVESRKGRQNICDDFRRDLIQAKSQKFQPGPEMDKGYFGGHSRCDPRGGVKGNGFPYLLCARGRDFVLFAKRSSHIGTIHLEAILAHIGGY